jgi:hypothetical protein
MMAKLVGKKSGEEADFFFVWLVGERRNVVAEHIGGGQYLVDKGSHRLP